MESVIVNKDGEIVEAEGRPFMLQSMPPEAELYAALARAQAKYPEIGKDKETGYSTKQGGRVGFRWAELGELRRKIQPILAAEGLSVSQPVTSSSEYVEAKTVLRHKGGGMIESPPLRFPCNSRDPKDYGKVITYACRYSYKEFLSIPVVDDPDLDHDGDAPQQPQKPQPMSEAQQLGQAVEKSDFWSPEKVKEAYRKKFEQDWPPAAKAQWIFLRKMVNEMTPEQFFDGV